MTKERSHCVLDRQLFRVRLDHSLVRARRGWESDAQFGLSVVVDE